MYTPIYIYFFHCDSTEYLGNSFCRDRLAHVKPPISVCNKIYSHLGFTVRNLILSQKEKEKQKPCYSECTS